MLGWDRFRSHNKRAGTSYAKLVCLHPVGSAGHVVRSGLSGARNVDTLFSFPFGPSVDPTKTYWETLHQICVFASGGIYGSCSAFWCVEGTKRDTLFVIPGWVRHRSHKKCVGTCYANLCFCIRWDLRVT
jgi:hypothetical protein